MPHPLRRTWAAFEGQEADTLLHMRASCP